MTGEDDQGQMIWVCVHGDKTFSGPKYANPDKCYFVGKGYNHYPRCGWHTLLTETGINHLQRAKEPDGFQLTRNEPQEETTDAPPVP